MRSILPRDMRSYPQILLLLSRPAGCGGHTETYGWLWRVALRKLGAQQKEFAMTDVEIPLQSVLPEDAHMPQRRFSNRDAQKQWTASVTTRTGVALNITPARPKDHDALERFFERVTREDLYFRFLTGLRQVDESRINAMLRDDDDFSIDFLAFESGSDEILATAMLAADANFDSAEFAVCTREDAKNKGISWALLDHAARYAEAMGVRRIYSLQSASQADALQLEREMGFAVRTSPDDPVHMLVEKIFG